MKHKEEAQNLMNTSFKHKKKYANFSQMYCLISYR